MASEEPFSGILPGWVARRALRIRARPLGASPTSLGPTEPVAAPSRRVVQQLAAPVQLDEEWRVAPRWHGGEHASTGIVVAASYRVPVAAPPVSVGVPLLLRCQEVCVCGWVGAVTLTYLYSYKKQSW